MPGAVDRGAGAAPAAGNAASDSPPSFDNSSVGSAADPALSVALFILNVKGRVCSNTGCTAPDGEEI